MALPSGVYIIENVRNHNWAILTNDDDGFDVKSGTNADTDEGHKWEVERLHNGTYLFRNQRFGNHASYKLTDDNYPSVISIRTGKPKRWCINSTRGFYWISDLDGDRCWTLKYDHHETPIVLEEYTHSDHQHWKIAPESEIYNNQNPGSEAGVASGFSSKTRPGLSVRPASTSAFIGRDIPQTRASHFVTRQSLLTQLEKRFERSPTTLSRLIVVLIGMGGVGKTQLALEYCIRLMNLGTVQAIFWLDASSLNSIYRALEIIAGRLLPGRVFDNPQDAATSVKEVLSSRSDTWLMVVDNLDDPSDWQDILQLLPDSLSGFILVTSRFSGPKELGRAIEIGRMEKPECLKLLLQPPEVDTEEPAAAEYILKRLGYHPMAVDQARACISKRRLSLREFADEFDTRKKKIMAETPQYWQYRRTLPDNQKVSRSLLTTWEMSLPLLGVGDAGKLRGVLTLFAFFYPVSISEELFIGNMSIFDNNGRWDHLAFENAVLQMQDLSLLRFSRRSSDEIVVSLHSMVSDWLRMRLDTKSRSTFLTAAISCLKNYLQSTQHKNFTTPQETLSHIDTICQVSEYGMQSSSFLGACSTFGAFYRKHGRLEDAERMDRCALTGKEMSRGPDMPTLRKLCATQALLENTGSVYHRRMEKSQGPDHKSSIFHHLGNFYKRLEDTKRAYNHTLSGKEISLVPDRTSPLSTITNLGLLHQYEDLERLCNLTLPVHEKSPNEKPTSILDIVYNLYKGRGRLEDVVRPNDRALSRKKSSEPDHMSTFNAVVHKLRSLGKGQGRLEDAEKIDERALVRKEKSRGTNHTTTLSIADNFKDFINRQVRPGVVERWYSSAIAGTETCGPDQTITPSITNNLKDFYNRQVRPGDMESWDNSTLAGTETLRGPNHMTALSITDNLKDFYNRQVRPGDTERWYSSALARTETLCGPDQTITPSITNNLKDFYNHQVRPGDMESWCNSTLAGTEKLLGPERMTTLSTGLANVQNFCKGQGGLEDAEKTRNPMQTFSSFLNRSD